ncbi:Polymerase/histidinol phosphatase-like protein [Phialemonium atrogriseum]|uniref:Histidinol-phosphatase n=1 Tax=Phialemonium atrogriseum TaxID=1093897 RepID=A0AAJ0BQL2_9PEZI|nr:Polymerase/histidinol phosphatase-like protein [Phialemonium atrogriseum]KAK1762257.1 Polymerase/histidinol phosphatase-like protein [Phialemonium atrogriseum]
MAFTMHSHSGQFCPGHAKDQLEDIVKHAISIGLKTIGLTEHMPRTELSDLYPEELDDPEASLAALMPRHEAYLLEARRLRDKYASTATILVGFEGEWIRPGYAPLVSSLSAHADVDYFIGSLHHAAGHPIDFDAAHYAAAVAACGGDEESLFAAYYDEQRAMLAALRPRVVGHFDLVRLFSAEPARRLRGWRGGGVWARVVRNLELVRGFDGWLECNTSALRKGLAEPYPCREIAEEWIRIGGKFTFSDDSHGIAQVATNYSRGLDYLESLGVKEVWTFERQPPSSAHSDQDSKPVLTDKAVTLQDFRASLNLGSD